MNAWANGFGQWHATVPPQPKAAEAARRVILAELAARDRVDPDAIRVYLAWGGNGRLCFAECLSRCEFHEYPNDCGEPAEVYDTRRRQSLCADHAHVWYPDIERGVEAVGNLELIREVSML